MKKVLIILGVLVSLVLVTGLIVPILFKDKIKTAIDNEINKTLNAEVKFDIDNFGLSIFRNFPNLTISIDEFAIIAKQEQFKGDSLFAVKKMRFIADILSVISGDKIKIKSIYLYQAHIATLTAKDGTSSWATLMLNSSADTVQTNNEEPSKFAINIEKWELEDATIIYNDETSPMFAQLNHLNHTGSGDLTQEIADVKTITSSSDFTLSMGDVSYFSGHSLNSKFNVNANYVKGEYKFLENEVAINNFKMGFEGSVSLNEKGTVLDVKFKALETEFKNIISLIPTIFMKDYEKLETSGKIAFNGYAKGILNEQSTPGYGLNLKIDEGMLHYPELPTAIKNVKTDLSVDNPDGISKNMVVHVKQFHMDMGSNPLDAVVLMEGMEPYKIKADVKGKINLEEITKIYPIEGTQLKGLFSLAVKADGMYSDTLKLMPIVDAKMMLTNGFVKTKEIPAPLDDVHFDIAANSNGQMSTTKIWVNDFNMKMEDEPFNLKAYFENLDNIKYDLTMKGMLDLAKLTKMYPVEGSTISGRIKTDLSTKGVMSDVEAGKYDRTTTSGAMDINNLSYLSKDFPQGMKLSKASFSLSPQKMSINSMEGFVGKSDINITGAFSNYMGYLFGTKDTVLRGNISFNSKQFDANEWMTEEESQQTNKDSSISTGIFEVPSDVDFTLLSNIGKVLYTNMVLENLNGTITVKNAVAKMSPLKFNILGGSFLFSGLYNTQNTKQPFFDISDFKMDNMQISDAYKTFNTVKTIAPIAENMKGAISITMNFRGNIDNNMMPVYNTLDGAGSAQIASAQLSGNKVMQGLGKLTKAQLDPLSMNDMNIKFRIEKGKVITQPFDINAGNLKMNLGGSNALDGKIDYTVKMDVPAGAAGAAVNNALANLTGKATTGNSNVKLDFKILGDYNSPKISLIGSSAGEDAKAAVKEAVVDKAKETIKNNEQVQKAQAEAERLKKESEEKAKAEADRLKQEAENKAKSEAERLKREAKKKFGF